MRSALNGDWSSEKTPTPASTSFFSKLLPVSHERDSLFTGFECLKRPNSCAAAILSSGWAASRRPDRVLHAQ